MWTVQTKSGLYMRTVESFARAQISQAPFIIARRFPFACLSFLISGLASEGFDNLFAHVWPSVEVVWPTSASLLLSVHLTGS